MPRQIGEFNVLKETEIASSSQGGKTSQLLCAEIENDCGNLLVWFEVEGEEPQIIGRYSPHFHTFTSKGTLNGGTND